MVISFLIVSRFFFTLNQPPTPDGTVRVLLLSKEENLVLV